MSVVASSAPARSGSTGTWVMVALAVLLSPLFLYLIVRAAGTGLSPALAASMPPADHTAVIRRLLPAFADPRVPVPAQVISMARSSALTSPISFEPFFVFARKASDEGNLERAITLMEEARRRRHNFLPTRLLLMAQYSQARRYPEALVEMEFALQSSEEVRRLVLPELIKAMRSRDGRVALSEVLARGPEWRGEFARIAENHSISPEEAADLLALIRARRPSADVSVERGIYLQALVRSGRVAEARAVWLQAFPDTERERFGNVFDGSFSGRKAQPPFGWVLHDVEAGRAEIARGDGRNSYLEVTYFGGKNVVLAEQMLALAPGAYRLSFNAKSDGGIASGELYWSLACVPDGPGAGRVPVRTPQPAYRTYEGELRVPAGCSGQMLRLHAEPGDVAATFTVQISNLQVVRP